MNSKFYSTSIAFFFLTTSILFGQKLTPEVLSSAGASASGGGVMLSWTVGEPIVSTFTTSNTILTQGFHQSKLDITALDLLTFPELNLSVYPNPVSAMLKLDIKGEGIKDLSFCLLAIDGKILVTKKMESLPELVNMEPFGNGAYLLKVYRDIEKPLRTFRIIKN